MSSFASDTVISDGVKLSSRPESLGDDTKSWQKQSTRQRYFSGRTYTLWLFTALSTIILAFNLGWLLWALKRYGASDGYGIIASGDCTRIKNLNTNFHAAINILSTILLLASNSFLLVASAPLRTDVDKEHANGKWLSIGLLSLRTLRRISWPKRLICFALLASSLPLHLFYNAAIFASLTGNEYLYAVVTESFLQGGYFKLSLTVQYPNELALLQGIQQSSTSYQRLNPQDCAIAYAKEFQTQYRTAILVSSAQNHTDAVLTWNYETLDIQGNTSIQGAWVCGESQSGGDGTQSCDPAAQIQNFTNWVVDSYPIQYCLVEPSESPCYLKFSEALAWSVIGCNAIKILAAVAIMVIVNRSDVLCCPGDAIASFLEDPDQFTQDKCVMGFHVVTTNETIHTAHVTHMGKRRWANSISRSRWKWSIGFMSLSVIVVGVVLFYAIDNLSSESFDVSAESLWALGFGVDNLQPGTLAISDGDTLTLDTVAVALIANLPQLVLAAIYYVYNGLFSNLFTTYEYSSFAFKSDTLMVSSPRGLQRGTWFFGIPWGWAVLSLAAQFALHWLVSQALFMVQIINIPDPRLPDQSENETIGPQSNLAYSPMAIILTLILTAVMAIIVATLVLRKSRPGSAPFVGNNSAAMSAICHPPHVPTDISFRKLTWLREIHDPHAQESVPFSALVVGETEEPDLPSDVRWQTRFSHLFSLNHCIFSWTYISSHFRTKKSHSEKTFTEFHDAKRTRQAFDEVTISGYQSVQPEQTLRTSDVDALQESLLIIS